LKLGRWIQREVDRLLFYNGFLPEVRAPPPKGRGAGLTFKAASLDGRAAAQKIASLLEKALTDNPDESSAYKNLLNLFLTERA
jgi:hypothetical protein